jgi:hypothetical protein
VASASVSVDASDSHCVGTSFFLSFWEALTLQAPWLLPAPLTVGAQYLAYIAIVHKSTASSIHRHLGCCFAKTQTFSYNWIVRTFLLLLCLRLHAVWLIGTACKQNLERWGFESAEQTNAISMQNKIKPIPAFLSSGKVSFASCYKYFSKWP